MGRSKFICSTTDQQQKILIRSQASLAEIAGNLIGTLDAVAECQKQLYEGHDLPLTGSVVKDQVIFQADDVIYEGIASPCRTKITGTVRMKFEDITVLGDFKFTKQNPEQSSEKIPAKSDINLDHPALALAI